MPRRRSSCASIARQREPTSRSIHARTLSVSLVDAPVGRPPAARQNPAHADDHRHGLRERQSDGRRPVERRVVLGAALDSVSPSRRPTKARRCRSGTLRTGAMRRSRPSAPSCPTRSPAQQYILAAYTCTPLVKIPVSDLKPGAQVKGTTIADLGVGQSAARHGSVQEGRPRLHPDRQLRARRAEAQADNLETYKPPSIRRRRIPVSPECPSTRSRAVTNVKQLSQLDSSSAVVLTATSGGRTRL